MNDTQIALFMAVQAWASGRSLTKAQRAYVWLVKKTLQS